MAQSCHGTTPQNLWKLFRDYFLPKPGGLLLIQEAVICLPQLWVQNCAHRGPDVPKVPSVSESGLFRGLCLCTFCHQQQHKYVPDLSIDEATKKEPSRDIKEDFRPHCVQDQQPCSQQLARRLLRRNFLWETESARHPWETGRQTAAGTREVNKHKIFWQVAPTTINSGSIVLFFLFRQVFGRFYS